MLEAIQCVEPFVFSGIEESEIARTVRHEGNDRDECQSWMEAPQNGALLTIVIQGRRRTARSSGFGVGVAQIAVRSAADMSPRI
jgi:hypothetical protein